MKKFGAQGSFGFSLIELMVTIAIIAILAAIAFPAYNGQVRKTARGHAVAEILKLAQQLERVRGKTFSYPTAADAVSNFTVKTNRYDIAATVPDSASFTITATPFLDQTYDKCGAITYAQDGSWKFSKDIKEKDCI